jgi:hypothetical protein
VAAEVEAALEADHRTGIFGIELGFHDAAPVVFGDVQFNIE